LPSFAKERVFQILEESLQGKVLSDEELKSIDLPSSTQAYAKTLHPDFFSYLSQHQVKHVLDLVHKANKHGTFECELIRSPSKDSVELLFVCPYPHSKLVGHILDLFSRRNLVIKRMSVSYVFAQAQEKILALACDLHGNDNMLAWDVCDMQLLIQELFFLNDFEADDVLYPLVYVEKKLEPIEAAFLRSLAHLVEEFTGQFGHVLQIFTTRLDLARDLFIYFSSRFSKMLPEQTQAIQKRVESLFKQEQDVFSLAYLLIEHMQKTNFFLRQKRILSFRIDNTLFSKLNKEIQKRFPVTPFGVFYLFSCHSVGFHIRFQNIARGGLRTVAPHVTAKHVLFECYELALTQQKKNKDIPEGGAKGVLFIQPDDAPHNQERFLFRLHALQKAYVEGLLSLVNIPTDKPPPFIDYYKQPEYLYLGPDELMHDSMVEWIANYSKQIGYAAGIAFITGKKKLGFHHKQYGVTSFGLTACLEHVLNELGIDPYTKSFTVKMSGGPDGDVAGNMIVNLYRRYPKTCKLLCLVDVSGLLYDPQGLSLEELVRLFHEGLPVRHFRPNLLHPGGFLLDRAEREGEDVFMTKAHAQERIDEQTAKELLATFVHKTEADLFIPAGGRPHTLSKNTLASFLHAQGAPTAKAIIEGANLYLSHEARHELEQLGTIIIKDSSANKGGVIASSFEVLCNSVLSEEEFIQDKEMLIQEVLDRIFCLCSEEVCYILRKRKESKRPCCEVSEKLSFEINECKHRQLKELKEKVLPSDPNPALEPFFSYVLPLLRTKYKQKLMNLVDEYKKAIIATSIASSKYN
jgi:glutamate dehydrogenase